MNRLRKFFQFGVGSFVGAVITTALGVFLLVWTTREDGFPVGQRFINSSFNLPFIPRPVISVAKERALIVFMDNDSHDVLAQPKNAAWDRRLHAKLLDRLKAGGAAAAVFDIVFSDPDRDPARDQVFIPAVKSFGDVVLAADSETSPNKAVAMRTMVLPIEPLLDAAADVGLAELRADDDLIVRRHYHGNKDDTITSMSWAAAKLAGAAVTQNDNNRFLPRYLNYYGPPGTIPSIPYYQALTSTNLAPDFFKGKTVFIGSKLLTKFAGERKDEYPSPFSAYMRDGRTIFMPGVEIQATQFLNLVRGDWLVRPTTDMEVLLTVLTGLLAGFIFFQIKRPFMCGLAGLVTVLVLVSVVYYFFIAQRMWMAWFIPVGIQIPLAVVWSIAINSVQLHVQKKLMEQSLSMYVSPKRVKQISRNSEILKPGAEKQEVSILFSDIANFTSMSEGMDSDELARVMNNYFEKAVGNCIQAEDGTVVKFIGDAIFAMWNAPERQKDHQAMACRGALRLSKEVSAFESAKKDLDVRTRIGLHCGVANVGNFGSKQRVDYTALGENINLASRMEGLNKYMGTDVLITGDVYRAVSDKFTTRFCGKFKLKGFERAVEVYELIADKAQAEETRLWREAYDAALKLYLKQDFDGAEAAWHKVIEMRGGKDGPSKFMLKHIAEMRARPLDPEWNGEVELKEK